MEGSSAMKFSLFRKIFYGLTAVVGLIGWSADAAAAVVSTPGGLFPAAAYSGTSANGVSIFRGIRFAAPPVGNLRWAPPAPPAAASGTVDATTFGSACPQLASPFGVASTNEDCLFLNVYVPGTVSSTNRLPVMVFYYGGAFVSGSASLYDPTELVTQGKAIVVTVNYRLGVLGYMASPELSATSANGVSGNYGLLDQQFALKWVRQNITAFGGNPSDVTIFGESAGGFSTCALLVAPSANGLFQRALTESGPCGFPLPTLAAAQTIGTTFTNAVGCANSSAATVVSCLRSLSTSEVLANQPSAAALLASPSGLTAFFPNVDGKIIPQQPETAIAFGQFNKVPVIEGTNKDEGRLFIALAFDLLRGSPLTAAEYPAQIQAAAAAITQQLANGGTPSSTTTDILTQEILNEYPLSNFNSPDEALATVLTDGTFSCPALVTDELLSLQVPTFAYEFADRNAPMLFLPPVSFPYGATHTDELQFLFTNLGGVPSQLSADETKLATTMKDYWTQFAKAGTPNALILREPFWPAFAITNPQIQSLVAPTPFPRLDFSAQHHCGFWQNILVQASVLSILTANGG